jgi:bifunctional UDP-N-acetylglucosamine pyrophosphorylase / glucosamine-1-phosphate N-acetyltransferase
MPLSVVILAAGQGKRMHSDLPKVLQPLAGQALLAHVLATAQQLTAERIIVVYGHGGEQVRQAFPDKTLLWALQATQQGTGHALMQAMEQIPDTDQVLVLYGDVPLVQAATLQQLLAAGEANTLRLLSVRLPDPTGYGRVLRDNSGKVYRIVEQKDANRKEALVNECNTGFMVAPAQNLRGWLKQLNNANAQGEYYLTDVIQMAVKDQVAVHAVETHNAIEVLGVNDKAQLAQVEAGLRVQRTSELMRQGVTLIDPTRVDIRGRVQAGKDVTLDVNVVLAGDVILGDRVHIGMGVVLKDVVIGADSAIRPYSVMEHTQVGRGAIIGPYARLRPGTQVGDGAHVGNFVELKATHLGAGSKANHLTYLGDTTVGENTNIGAGTITCNYDGQNKWPIEIGDNVFIGSGNMLVAPIQIGDDATTGAGSTLTQSIEPKALAVERADARVVPRWKRPGKLTAEEKTKRVEKSKLKPT